MIRGGPWDRDSQNKGSQGSGGLSRLSHYSEVPQLHTGPGNLKEKDSFMDSENTHRW